MVDHLGRIVGWNLGAEHMMGYSSKEVLHKKYATVIAGMLARTSIMSRALARAKRIGQTSIEGVHTKKDGTQFWAHSLILPIKSANGEIHFFAIITRDLTDQRQTEQKREEYIGIASHELKNPVTTLSLYSELLAKRLELDRNKENLNMLRDIQGQTNRLTNLIDDLMVVGKIETGTLTLHKEIFHPQALIKHIVENFNDSVTSHKIHYKGSCTRYVRADKNRIGQVIINLITNAIKYSPTAHRVIVSARVRGSSCVVSVQDFGSGIARKDQQKIFTRYYRASDSEAGNVAGSGLGLYISKAIMNKHRQRLWVKSVVRKGTTFFFTVPLVPLNHATKRRLRKTA